MMTVGELRTLLAPYPDDMPALMDEQSRGRAVHITGVVCEAPDEEWDVPRDVVGLAIVCIE